MDEFGWENYAERKIREAMEEGEFADLKGQGEPLNLDENPFEEGENWTAHHLLKNNGYTLPWISRRKEIHAELAQIQVPLRRTLAICRDRLAFRPGDAQAQLMLDRAVANYRQRLGEVNRKIDNYNLMVPSESFLMLRVDAEAALQKLLAE